jgi:hypothetical protein
MDLRKSTERPKENMSEHPIEAWKKSQETEVEPKREPVRRRAAFSYQLVGLSQAPSAEKKRKGTSHE